MKLGVNIDHVATLRQARYVADIAAHNAEPSVLAAAKACEAAGASSITLHLRATVISTGIIRDHCWISRNASGVFRHGHGDGHCLDRQTADHTA